jgi:hypothetical protein
MTVHKHCDRAWAGPLIGRFCQVSRQVLVWRLVADLVELEAAEAGRISRWIVSAVARRRLRSVVRSRPKATGGFAAGTAVGSSTSAAAGY